MSVILQGVLSRGVLSCLLFRFPLDFNYPRYSHTMYGCESWTIKKADHQRIYAFEL